MAATVPAALLFAYGLSFSLLGETPIHRSIDLFWDGPFGIVLDALWHPAVILGGLLVALVLSGGPFLRAGKTRRNGVTAKLGWYGWVLNVSITVFAATLMAAILLYLFVENAAPHAAG
ncbi:MAG: hypothetical protein GY791_08745 [Alphaproteobacteria bacterium]|nr:hypothetical protein [Alphaproteobacteria bacterium]